MATRPDLEELEKRVEADLNNVVLLLEWAAACKATGDDVKVAEAFTRLAERLELAGSPLKAMMFLKDALELDPSRTDTRRLLIELHLVYGFREEAVEYYWQQVSREGRTTPPGAERELIFAGIFFESGLEAEGRAELARAEVALRAESPVLADELLRMMALEDMDAMSEAMVGFVKRLCAARGLDFAMPN